MCGAIRHGQVVIAARPAWDLAGAPWAAIEVGRMTKQVANLVGTSIHINESELAFLRLLEEGGGRSSLSTANIAKAIGLKGRSASRISRSLEEKGLVVVQPRYLGNGAQLENEYALTQKGREVIELAGRRPQERPASGQDAGEPRIG